MDSEENKDTMEKEEASAINGEPEEEGFPYDDEDFGAEFFEDDNWQVDDNWQEDEDWQVDDNLPEEEGLPYNDLPENGNENYTNPYVSFQEYIDDDPYARIFKQKEEERIAEEKRLREEEEAKRIEEEQRREAQKKRNVEKPDKKGKKGGAKNALIAVLLIAVGFLSGYILYGNMVKTPNPGTEDTKTASAHKTETKQKEQPEIGEKKEKTKEKDNEKNNEKKQETKDIKKETTDEKDDKEKPKQETKNQENKQLAEPEPEPEPAPAQISYTASMLVSGNAPTDDSKRIKVVSATASSTIEQEKTTNEPLLMFDNDYGTNWQEGVPGSGIGESVTAVFKQKEKVKYIGFRLGNWKTPDYYWGNHRPKKLTLELGSFRTQAEFPDTCEEYVMEITPACEADSLKITIDDVYPGANWDDTVISDINLYRE